MLTGCCCFVDLSRVTPVGDLNFEVRSDGISPRDDGEIRAARVRPCVSSAVALFNAMLLVLLRPAMV